jgi:hypothetical protein
MRRIIGLDVFDGKPIDGEYTLTVHELGNGHREAVVRQAIGWEHVHTLRQDEADHLEEKYGERDAEEKREANLKRSARRAKTRVRRLVKSMGCDSLLTLTYRENMTDLALSKAHLKEFVRRMRRVIPGFAYVAAWEQQQRGAWHVHLAVHRLPKQLPASNGVKVKSWNIVRAVWRSVVGELGGNIDERKRKARSKFSASKLAGYLSKYMTKAYDDGDAWSNRFSASQHSIPEPVRSVFRGESLNKMIELAYSFAADGVCQITTWLSKFGDTFFLSSEGGGGLHNPDCAQSIHCR